MENKKVELVVRIDGQECFYVVPEGYNPPNPDISHGLDAEVEAIIRTTTNVQETEWNIIRIMVAMASSRIHDKGKRIEVFLDEDGNPGVRNPETGETTSLTGD